MRTSTGEIINDLRAQRIHYQRTGHNHLVKSLMRALNRLDALEAALADEKACTAKLKALLADGTPRFGR